MSIDVIKHGSQDLKNNINGKTCKACGCTFSYNAEDIIKIRSLNFVRCPDCGRTLVAL